MEGGVAPGLMQCTTTLGAGRVPGQRLPWIQLLLLLLLELVREVLRMQLLRHAQLAGRCRVRLHTWVQALRLLALHHANDLHSCAHTHTRARTWALEQAAATICHKHASSILA